MSSSLHTYNTELVKAISELKEKRAEISAEITEEEQEKELLQEEIAALTARLQGVEESLVCMYVCVCVL
jgi:Sjoegren syndrome nuclear autoantigen 1